MGCRLWGHTESDIASPFGIFLSGDDSGTGKTMQFVIREINEEFLDRINAIKDTVSYEIGRAHV